MERLWGDTLLGDAHSSLGAVGRPERRRGPVTAMLFEADRRRLRVGLVNNMPDAALAAAERQFRALVEAAAPDRRIEFRLFHLPSISRGEAAARLRASYSPVEAIETAALDALIVTGAEPCARDLRAEPFWDDFRRLVDHTQAAGLPTLWSCLAAHAAVLHLDGVGRRPLPRKCSGLYACAPATPDALLQGLGPAWLTPHSRHNTLDEAELAGRGYRILSRSPAAGVDVFTGGVWGQFLFLQGHPEYEPASLALEFRRDLQRYLEGLRETPPGLPEGVFGPRTAQRLEALAEEARQRRRPELMARWPTQAEITLAQNSWRAPAAKLYRNWLAAGRVEAGMRLSA